jgi:NADH:ubiquinone oxidoreductase subunit 6 (subunit J)
VLIAFGFLILRRLHAPRARCRPTSAATSASGPVGRPTSSAASADFGVALFTTQLLPFEVTAFVLMVAVIGVVVIASDAVPRADARTSRRAASAPKNANRS